MGRGVNISPRKRLKALDVTPALTDNIKIKHNQTLIYGRAVQEIRNIFETVGRQCYI